MSFNPSPVLVFWFITLKVLLVTLSSGRRDLEGTVRSLLLLARGPWALQPSLATYKRLRTQRCFVCQELSLPPPARVTPFKTLGGNWFFLHPLVWAYNSLLEGCDKETVTSRENIKLKCISGSSNKTNRFNIRIDFVLFSRHHLFCRVSHGPWWKCIWDMTNRSVKSWYILLFPCTFWW